MNNHTLPRTPARPSIARAIVLVLVAIAACAPTETRPHENDLELDLNLDPLHTVLRAARGEPRITALLQPTARGFTPADGGARFTAARPGLPGGVDVHLPRDARASIGLGLDGLSPLSLQHLDATSAGLELREGRALYRDIYPATDAVIAVDERRFEEILVLRSSAAPSHFSWQLDLPPTLHARSTDPALVSLVDDHGAEIARLSAPWSVDAAGRRVPVRASLRGGRFSLELETHGLRFPLVLDPIVELAGVWEDLTTRGPLTGAAMAFDRARNVVVLFGGQPKTGKFVDETWEWNGSRWSRRRPLNHPTQRAYAQMAYDEDRQKIVLFGGNSLDPLNDTWEWDGSDWTRVGNTSNSPSARQEHQMAFDAVTHKVLLFGGLDTNGTTARGDTWLFGDATWTQVADGPPTLGSAMAASPAHDIVRFGGFDAKSQQLATTSIWDGSSWKDVTPIPSPTARHDASLAFDEGANRLVLFGGIHDGGAVGDLWQWDGASWSLIDTTLPPPARQQASMAWDGHQVILAGGWDNDFKVLADTWALSGASWADISAENPPALIFPGLVYDEDRHKIVLFGGYRADDKLSNETWQWDGAWRRATTPNPPPERHSHAMTYDAERHCTVVFGGATLGNPLNDTWTWDGTEWLDKKPKHAPSVRREAAMAYHHDSKKVVLQGGRVTVPDAKTWVWDGDDWQPRSVPDPGPHAQHTLVDDRKNKKLVLFGGIADQATSDTWTWDGANWHLENPLNAPLARYMHSSTYDTLRERVIVFGGYISPGALSDVDEWDGAQWQQVPAEDGPGIKAQGALAFDEEQRGALFFGGTPGFQAALASNETWLYHVRGGGCTDDAQCDTLHCVKADGASTGICCEQASCDPCFACDTPKDPGRCAPVTPPVECGKADCGDGKVMRSSCDAAGACIPGLCAAEPCDSTADCGKGFVCSAARLCVSDEPFPVPTLGCALAPRHAGARDGLVTLAALALIVARRRRRRLRRPAR